MTTEERLSLIVEAAPIFAPYTGAYDLEQLRQWRAREFGDRHVLVPKNILHIISGNTPHAAYQSLLRGLVIGSHNRLKLPNEGLSDFESTLPSSLSSFIETARTLPEHWILEAEVDAMVVYGNDATIRHFRNLAPLEVPFLAHGHRVGIAIIEAPSEKAAHLAAKDICEFDQQGCLSLQTIYLHDPRSFAPLLAQALTDFESQEPRSPLSLSQHGAISNLRSETQYLAAQEPEKHQLWQGKTWTIIFSDTPELEFSPGGRTVFLKPIPQDLSTRISRMRHLSGIALYPFENRTNLPSPRIFPLGQAQEPPTFWQHDGVPPLASLVRFQDRG